MKWIHRFKFKYQLYILFSFLILFLLFVYQFSFVNLWKSFYADTLSQAHSSNNQIAQNISTRLDYLIDSTSDFATDATLCSYLENGDYFSASSYLDNLSNSFCQINIGKVRSIRLVAEGEDPADDFTRTIGRVFRENISANMNNYIFIGTKLNSRNELIFSLVYRISISTPAPCYICLEIYESEIYTYINQSNFAVNIYYHDSLISSTNRNLLYTQSLSRLSSAPVSENLIHTSNSKDFLIETDMSGYDFQNRFYQNYLSVIVYIIGAVIITAIFLLVIVRYLEKRFGLLNQKIQLLGDWNFTRKIVIEGNDEFSQLSLVIDETRQKIWNLLQEVNNTNRMRRHAEIKALRSQINSHFLFNALSTIKWLAKTGQLYLIEKSVGYLSTFLHFSLRIEEDTVCLRKEAEQLDAYLNLEKLKFQDEINFHIAIDEDIMDLPCAKVILQPIVENSISHARRDDRSCLNIVIYGWREGENYSIIIEDDGRGMTPQQLQDFKEGKLIPKNNGYGLKNIMERVKFINGGTVTLESEVGVYTKVIITQPVPTENTTKPPA